MGAAKTKQFSEFEKCIANFGRAMAHPARIRIMDILHNVEWCRSTDLIRDLKLSQASVHNHVRKLKEAELIKIDFLPNCYMLTLNHNSLGELKEWTGSFQ